MDVVLAFVFDVPDDESVLAVVERVNDVLLHVTGTMTSRGYPLPDKVAVSVDESAEAIVEILKL